MREGFELRRERHSRFVGSGIAAALRKTGGADQRTLASLLAMLTDLERRVRDGERERLYAEVDRRIDELLRTVREACSGDRISP
jgi:hypothetical protein